MERQKRAAGVAVVVATTGITLLIIHSWYESAKMREAFRKYYGIEAPTLFQIHFGEYDRETAQGIISERIAEMNNELAEAKREVARLEAEAAKTGRPSSMLHIWRVEERTRLKRLKEAIEAAEFWRFSTKPAGQSAGITIFNRSSNFWTLTTFFGARPS